MDFRGIVSHFNNPKWRGPDSCLVTCPCHQDSKQSLGLSVKDGKTLLHCFAGCATEDILAAAGLTMKDLFVDARQGPDVSDKLQAGLARWNGGVPPERIYNYRDENGVSQYVKIHYPGKNIRYARVSWHDGTFQKGRGDVKPVLYGLPELIAAVKAGETIYCPEGEKDCATLKEMGFAATTAGGTGDWKQEFARYFKGANVVILPDNDDAGRKLAERVKNDLMGVAASMKVVPTSKAPKGDVTDWIQEGHTKEEFLALVEAAPFVEGRGGEKTEAFQTVTAKELMTMQFRELIQPVKGLICEGLTFLVAPSKAGKSWLSLLMAVCVAQGIPFLGRETTQCRVAYLALEDSLRRIQSRLRAIGVTDAPSNLMIATKAQVVGDGLESQFESWLNESDTPALIIIDVFQKIRGASDRWKNAYENDYQVVGALKRIADKHRAAIVCVHHTNKMQNVADPFQKISGSTGIMGAADTILLLDRERGSDTATVHIQGRDIWGDDFLIRFTDGRWELVSGNAEDYVQKKEYEASSLVQLFRKLVTENPQGGRWTYEELKAIGLEAFGDYPFIDGKDCGRRLNDGLAKELKSRDGIIVECGVKIKGVKGVRINHVTPKTDFQAKIPI